MHPETWEPFTEIIELVRELSKNNTIVVVTARDEWNRPEIEAFIHMHKIPIEKVYCTDNDTKRDILVHVGAIRHYDDKMAIAHELTGTGIEFVLVTPKTRSWKSLGKQ